MDDLRRGLMSGTVEIPRAGQVIEAAGVPPFYVTDSADTEVEPATEYLRSLFVGDVSPLSIRSYAFDLLRWFRLLWLLETAWQAASSADVTLLVGWMRSAPNQQRRRSGKEAPPAGAVNLRTGKPYLRSGYAPRTINHTLTVVHAFYAFHSAFGEGPVINPVPVNADRRQALAHRSPLEPKASFRRAKLRQKVSGQVPRAIPDAQWDELFAALTCDRDRALLLLYVSSGARASELLNITIDDIDWAGMRIYVISKGTRLRQAVPGDPAGFAYLARYLAEAGVPEAGQPVWRALHGKVRALTYWALRRMLQRVNARVGTNWTLHDLRHTAAIRMANDPKLTLSEVQAILRHADLKTTGQYLAVRVEDLFDKLQEHYARPRQPRTYAAGYDPADVAVVFGG